MAETMYGEYCAFSLSVLMLHNDYVGLWEFECVWECWLVTKHLQLNALVLKSGYVYIQYM